MSDVKNIDWQDLEFTCTQEKNLLPKPDPEAEQWYQEANRLHKTHPAGNDTFEKQILKLMLQAAERNHAKALNNLVVMYSQADGVDADEAKAVDYAERLIKMNVGMGYYHMGVFLEQGIGVKPDRKAALTYFRKSADLGNAQGQLVVGDKIIGEFLMTPMRDKAISIGVKMLECSLAQDHAPAGYELGMHYAISEPNIEKSLAYFQKAGALGHNDSLFWLYSAFEAGEDGVAKDPQRAACYYKLRNELSADKTKRFPNIDKLCPLPLKPMPKSPA